MSLCLIYLACATANAGEIPVDLEHRFSASVRPFLETYCISCHGVDEEEADLDLGMFDSASSVAANPQLWELVQEQIAEEAMHHAKRKDILPERPGRRCWLGSWSSGKTRLAYIFEKL